MIVQVEKFSPEVFAEILPFAQRCWDENTVAKAQTCAFYGERDFAIDPDIDQYRKLSESGSLVLVTLRDEGKLAGYAVGLLYRSLHHKAVLCGIADSIYVDPPFRSVTAVMMERLEKELQARGAQILGWPASPAGPVHALLEARGYVADDVVMEKRLCA